MDRHTERDLCVGSSGNLHAERKSHLLGEGDEAHQGSVLRPPALWTPSGETGDCKRAGECYSCFLGEGAVYSLSLP